MDSPQLIERKYQPVYFSTAVLAENQFIETNCAAMTFYNSAPLVGGASVFVNGFELKPGVGIEYGVNQGEVDITQLNITFGAGIPNCTLWRYYYVGLNN